MSDTPLNPDAIRELTEAIRLTVEYVGTGMLPAIPGWSWYDAMVKYAPNDAEVLRAMDPLPEPAAALPEVTSVEELEALPAKTVILDSHGDVSVITETGLFMCDDGDCYELDEVADDLPARVLYRPEVKP